MAETPGRSMGGRFTEPTDRLLQRLNRSVDVDRRLWRQDVQGSRAHARMLGRVGLLVEADVAALLAGLDLVEAEFTSEAFHFEEADEDVHMAVERRLGELIGEPARRLHTGRSRNDQVMLDITLWLREALGQLRAELVAWISALLQRAEEGISTPMPSFTHLQPAQVSSVAQWLLAHAAEAERNLRRLDDMADRLDECPLGAGASAGSYLPIEREQTARELGFARASLNSIQTTGARGELLDALGLLVILGVGLSRLGEELVLFASPAYGFLRLPDGLTTGSSLLPHKRNPDGAELLRAGGKLPALDHAALSSLCCGLVSGYSKDLQHDKSLLFRSFDRVMDLLGLARIHVERLRWDAPRLEAACGQELAALWLADRLVLSGLPFREAHHLVGLASRRAGEEGQTLAQAAAGIEGLTGLAAELSVLTPLGLLEGLRSAGGAGPESTRAQIERLRAITEGRG